MTLESKTPLQFEKELQRKAFHMLVMVLPIFQFIFPYNAQTHNLLVLIGVFLGMLLLGMEVQRLRNPCFFTNRFARDSEKNQIATYIPLFFVAYLIFLIFGLKIAIIAIFVSALGDAASAIFGIRFGAHLLPFTNEKSIEGAIAGFCATFLVAMVYVKIALSLAFALIMVLSDFVENPKTTFLSDNFLNPFFFAVFIYLFP